MATIAQVPQIASTFAQQTEIVRGHRSQTACLSSPASQRLSHLPTQYEKIIIMRHCFDRDKNGCSNSSANFTKMRDNVSHMAPRLLITEIEHTFQGTSSVDTLLIVQSNCLPCGFNYSKDSPGIIYPELMGLGSL